MDYLPEFGTDELQRHPSGVRARLLPEAGGRWVNKVSGRHYAYLTLEKPDGYEVERISCHRFATAIGEVAERVSWGDTFEVWDHRRGEPAFYVTLAPLQRGGRGRPPCPVGTRRPGPRDGPAGSHGEAAMTGRATVNRTRSGNLRGSVDPQALARDFETLKSDVSGIKKVLAPAFAAPMENTVDGQPERYTTSSTGGMQWERFPDHDPDFLSGRITLEQARTRHARPDEGCQCPNCQHQRKADARIVSPEPEPQAACPFCRGTGYTGRPEGMGSASCPDCRAEEFERLHRESYQGNQYTAVSAALTDARQRVIDCTGCGGSGRVPVPVSLTPCSPCRGTGRDNHVAMPKGVLWPRADGGMVKADAPGMQQQATHWSTRPEPGYLPEPPPPHRDPSAEPAFATARQHATVPPRPPESGEVLKGLGG